MGYLCFWLLFIKWKHFEITQNKLVFDKKREIHWLVTTIFVVLFPPSAYATLPFVIYQTSVFFSTLTYFLFPISTATLLGTAVQLLVNLDQPIKWQHFGDMSMTIYWIQVSDNPSIRMTKKGGLNDFESDLVWVFQKLQISTQPSLGFTQDGPKRENIHWGQFFGWNGLVDARGQWRIARLIEKQQ